MVFASYLGEARNAEVEDLDLALGGHHHVLGLHIPVDDPDGVGGGQDVEQLLDGEEHLIGGKPAAPGGGALAQGRALQQLHHQEGAAVVIEIVVEHVDDPAVLDLVGEVSLPTEAGCDVGIDRPAPVEHLHRAPHAIAVSRGVHRAHAAHIDQGIQVPLLAQGAPNPGGGFRRVVGVVWGAHEANRSTRRTRRR